MLSARAPPATRVIPYAERAATRVSASSPAVAPSASVEDAAVGEETKQTEATSTLWAPVDPAASIAISAVSALTPQVAAASVPQLGPIEYSNPFVLQSIALHTGLPMVQFISSEDRAKEQAAKAAAARAAEEAKAQQHKQRQTKEAQPQRASSLSSATSASSSAPAPAAAKASVAAAADESPSASESSSVEEVAAPASVSGVEVRETGSKWAVLDDRSHPYDDEMVEIARMSHRQCLSRLSVVEQRKYRRAQQTVHIASRPFLKFGFVESESSAAASAASAASSVAPVQSAAVASVSKSDSDDDEVIEVAASEHDTDDDDEFELEERDAPTPRKPRTRASASAAAATPPKARARTTGKKVPPKKQTGAKRKRKEEGAKTQSKSVAASATRKAKTKVAIPIEVSSAEEEHDSDIEEQAAPTQKRAKPDEQPRQVPAKSRGSGKGKASTRAAKPKSRRTIKQAPPTIIPAPPVSFEDEEDPIAQVSPPIVSAAATAQQPHPPPTLTAQLNQIFKTPSPNGAGAAATAVQETLVESAESIVDETEPAQQQPQSPRSPSPAHIGYISEDDAELKGEGVELKAEAADIAAESKVSLTPATAAPAVPPPANVTLAAGPAMAVAGASESPSEDTEMHPVTPTTAPSNTVQVTRSGPLRLWDWLVAPWTSPPCGQQLW